MNITLTPFETAVCELWALERMKESEKKGLSVSKISRVWGEEITGTLCELAVAKYLGVYPEFTVNTFKAPDVSGLQIRGTTHPAGRLIVRPDDRDVDVFVLVIRNFNTFDIKGWVTGAKAKQVGTKEAPNNRPPCWFVPPEKLNKLDLLPGYMAGKLKH